jgi:hypothetical protein
LTSALAWTTLRAMSNDKVNRTRRIDDGDPLFLWDPPKDDGAIGYAVITAICNNPHCDCTRMTLFFRPVQRRDDGRAEMGQRDVASADVSFDGTDLKFDKDAMSKLTDQTVEWIRQRLQEQNHQAWFQERWRRSRGQIGDPAFPSGAPPATIDGMVFFNEVFPYDFDLTAAHNQRLYLAEDQYCLEPTCTCDEIAVQFIDLATDAKTIGHVRASVGRIHAPKINGPSLVSELWRDLLDHIGHDRLRDRFRRMRRVARQRTGTKTISEPRDQKVGRNDPCPCGSGKKYKRCCGTVSAPAPTDTAR